jgi:hypothetical protein
MSRWPHDDPASLAAFYGDPDHGEPGKQLVPVVPPFAMTYTSVDKDGKVTVKPVSHIQFHRKAAPSLLAALNEIWLACGRSQARVDGLRISRYSGAYNPRYVRGTEPGNPQGHEPVWSEHAYGAAIDFDAEHNGLNTGHGTMPQLVIDAFKRQGALWGGDYHKRTDPMHFEFCSRDPVARPVALVDAPQADGDSDAEQDVDDAAPVAQGAPTAGGFVGRARNWVFGIFSSIGLGGVGALTNWEIAVVLLVAIFAFAVVLFGAALWLWGKQNVADWIARHIA